MNMTGGKFMTRFIAVLFMGAAFAGCAFVLSTGEQSLFADVSGYEMPR